MLDVKIGAETYVMENHSNVGVGINRMSTATFGWEGYENPFDNFEEAKTYLLSLLKKQLKRLTNQRVEVAAIPQVGDYLPVNDFPCPTI